MGAGASSPGSSANVSIVSMAYGLLFCGATSVLRFLVAHRHFSVVVVDVVGKHVGFVPSQRIAHTVGWREQFFGTALVVVKQRTRWRVSDYVLVLFHFHYIIFRLCRLRRAKDCGYHYEHVLQDVKSDQVVRVPVEGVVFQWTSGMCVYCFFNGARVFLVANFPMRRGVSVGDPYLSTYPWKTVIVTLVHGAFRRVSIGDIVRHCIVAEAVQARLVLFHRLYITRHRVVMLFVPTVFYDPGRRFGVRRVVRSNVIEPVRFYRRAQPQRGYPRLKIVGSNRFVYAFRWCLPMFVVVNRPMDVTRATVRLRSWVIVTQVLQVGRESGQFYVAGHFVFSFLVFDVLVVVPWGAKPRAAYPVVSISLVPVDDVYVGAAKRRSKAPSDVRYLLCLHIAME